MNSVTSEERYPTTEAAPSLIDRMARELTLKMMAGIRHGRLLVSDGVGDHSFGNDQEPPVRLIVHHPRFYRKVLFGGSIGSGEAYVDGFWESDDLVGLVRIMVRNMGLLDRMEQGFAWLLRPMQLMKHLQRSNSRKQVRRNILAHYDLGNEMYQSFLDPTMMYSSAIYPHRKCCLEEAAVHKLDVICRKLDLQPGDRVIEIGSGWGGFAIHAAKNYGCHVTTTTISAAQYEEAQKRVLAAGLDKRISLLQSDYRDLSGRYDKLVSIEMIEAVGHRYLPAFFQKCCELLEDHGTMLLQAITIRDQKYLQYVRSVDFIQTHIFPGGCLPSNQRMLELLTTKTDLVVRHIEDFGYDYARTLRHWRERFLAAMPSLKRHGYDETFRRLWEFYFCYCEGGFWERAISVVHLLATRPGHRGEAWRQ
jgi:cyclopropane-fatty-acyl-phospholipid synthase